MHDKSVGLRAAVRRTPGTILAVGLLSGFLSAATEPWKGVRLSSLRADMEDRLPFGSPREDVEAWFVSHQISYGAIHDGVRGKQVGLMAIVPEGGFQNSELQIYFYFDDQGQLIGRRIERFHYSW